MPGPDDGLDWMDLFLRNSLREDRQRASTLAEHREKLEAIEQNSTARSRDLLARQERRIEKEGLSARRFERLREILAWLTKESNYMEPPAFLIYLDGSGTLFVGSETLEREPELRTELEQVVGSSRWGTRRRENGAEDLTLTFCHLELEATIPKVD